MPWLKKKQALCLNVVVVPKTEPFMSFYFSGMPDVFSPRLEFFFIIILQESFHMICIAISWAGYR